MITKAEMRKRLYYWDQHPPPNGYSQSTYQLGPDGRKYRNDCSGYVSMVTGMVNSPATSLMVSDRNIAIPISKEQLSFGDVMLTNGHVVMFDGWVDRQMTQYNGHDFGSGSMPRHKAFRYPYPDSRPFAPYRLPIVLQTADPGPSAPATPGVPSTPDVPGTGSGLSGSTGTVGLVAVVVIALAVGGALIFTQIGD